VVGNPIRLRFPPTISGRRVMFFDLEDETGLLNVTCFDDVYQKYGHAVICNQYITLWGEAQDRDGHTAFMAQAIFEYKPEIKRQIEVHDEIPLKVGDFLMT
jgi:error-prone DNA polymerase